MPERFEHWRGAAAVIVGVTIMLLLIWRDL